MHQPASISEFVLALALYVCFVRTEPSRLATQRACIVQARTALGLPATVTAAAARQPSSSSVVTTEDHSLYGFKLLVYLYALTIGVIALYFLYEGRPDYGASTLLISALYCTAAWRSWSKASTVWLARVLTLHAHYHIAQGTVFDEPHYRRAMVVRELMNLVFFESVEESLINLLCVGIAVSTAQPRLPAWYFYLPIKMFFLCDLPLRVLGITEYIASLATRQTPQLWASKSKRFLSGVHFFSALVPTCLVLWTGTGHVASTFYWWQTVLGLVLALACYAGGFGRILDKFVAGNVNARDARYLPWRLLVGNEGECTAVVEEHAVHHHCNALHAPLIALVVVSSALRWHHARVALMTARLLHTCVDARPCSQVQLENVLLLTVLLAIHCVHSATTTSGVDEVWGTNMAIALSWLAALASLLMTCCRELAASKIKDEMNADKFVSHAIKQRFDAVGAFIDHLHAEFSSVLQQQRHAAAVDDDNNDIEYLCADLAKAQRDCRLGHDRCHASNLSRFYSGGSSPAGSEPTATDGNNHRPPTTPRSGKWKYGELKHHIRRLPFAREFLPASWLEFDLDTTRFAAEVAISLDWEVFDLCLSEWTQGGRSKLIRLSTTKVKSSSPPLMDIELELDRVDIHPTFFPGLLRLLDSINAHLSESSDGGNLKLTLRARVLAMSPVSSNSPSTTSALGSSSIPRLADEHDYIMLRPLRFALLDDTKLIRNTFEHLMVKSVKVPAANVITSGSTLHQSKFFPVEICNKQVDIAIFDQNLDYDDTDCYIKGVDLARAAVLGGFHGCLVLHTSDAAVHDLMASNPGLFHGCIEKSADKAKFLEGLQSAWRNYTNSHL